MLTDSRTNTLDEWINKQIDAGDTIQRFTPTTEFKEGWSGNFRGECSREVISVK